jgi:3-deoxy-manno-octulosonate cytidylyltransferase (CMP-KDO synthetase)
MTGSGHASGTDRVAEVAEKIEADIFVNLQGDEPLIRPEMIDDVIMLLGEPGADIATLACKILFSEHPEDYTDPNVVKAVFDKQGFALYFSRSPIPHGRDEKVPRAVYKHLGIYGYRREALLKLTGLPPTPLEEAEKLEQLRALEHGMRIRIKETEFDTIGVDTPEDLEKVEKWLNSYS